MASYLDTKAHHGQWLLRIEDVDETRTIPGAAESIIGVLMQLGMRWDGEIVWQTSRKDRYQAAAERLKGHVYPCACTRREIADSQLGIASDGAAIYPGTCRHGLAPGRIGRTLRLQVPDPQDAAGLIRFDDRWQGPHQANLATEAGDFVLKRAEGFWAYQLAVVVDDAEQGVTHVVRGADLLDSTPRQIYLQHLLGFPVPVYLHVPVVNNASGEKLSKQTGAVAIEAAAEDAATLVRTLRDAAQFLGLQVAADSVQGFWTAAVPAWAMLYKS